MTLPGLTYQTALMILGISAVASNSLIALWVAFSRRHWFWRAAALLAAEAALLSIPARDLAYFFLAHALVAVLPFTTARVLRGYRSHLQDRDTSAGRRPFWQFSLRDLLLATVAAGVAAAELARLVAVEEPSMWVALAGGAAMGVITIGTAAGAIGRRWRKTRFIIAILLIFVLAGLTEPRLVENGFLDHLTEHEFFSLAGSTRTFEFDGLGVASMLAFFWLLIAKYCGVIGQASRLAEEQSKRPQSRLEMHENATTSFTGRHVLGNLRNLLSWIASVWAWTTLVTVSVLIVVPISVALMFLPPPPSVPEPFQAGPNAYPEIMRLAAKENWSSIPTGDWDTATLAALQTFEAQNRDWLAKVSGLVEQACWVPVNYEDKNSVALADAQSRRQVCRSYCTIARLAFMNDHAFEGAKLLADELVYAEAATRGGLILDNLVGCALTGAAIDAMRREIEKLTELETREVLLRLVSLEAQREPSAAYANRDKLWERLCYGWQARLEQALRSWLVEPAGIGQAYESANQRTTAHLRLLICELAVHAFHSANGREPAALEELVPRYLPNVPWDPFSDRPLNYRRTDDGHLLYSVGPNGVDDGGKRVPWSELSAGDLFLDLPDEPVEESADAPSEEDASEDGDAAAPGEDADGEM